MPAESAYPAYLYGGIDFLEPAWEALTLENGITAYRNLDGREPRIGRIGNHVFVEGYVYCAVPSGGKTAFLVPEKYRITRRMMALNPCGGQRVTRLFASPHGQRVVLEWCYSLGGSAYTSATWHSVKMDWFSDEEAPMYFPAAPMTANAQTGDMGCTASTSGAYSTSYAAYKAFDGDSATSWSSKHVFTGGVPSEDVWLQLSLPLPVKNVKVHVYSRVHNIVAVPVEGYVEGSQNGEDWLTIGAYSGWDETLNDGSLLGTVECVDDYGMKFQHIRLHVTRVSKSIDYATIGEMIVEGVF